MKNTAAGMESIARWGLVATILAAPWFLGGYRLTDQAWIFAAVIACYLLWWLSSVLKGSQAQLVVPWTLIAAAGVIGLCVLQLMPMKFGHPAFKNVFFPGWLGVDAAGPISIEPAASRLYLAKLAVAFLACLLAVQVFSTAYNRRIVWYLLAINGACLGIFGLAQRLSWNGQLFWTIPLRFGGQPFASYVNRNNAAGYLCMCLTAGFAALMAMRLTEGSMESVLARFKRRTLVLPRRGWENREVMVLVLSAGTMLGIFASFSRGGMIAATLTFVCGTLMLWVALGMRGIWYAVPFLIVPVVGAVWLNMDQSIQKRLSSLTVKSTLAADARVQHWQDTLRATPDVPLGSGLGTYRYVNRPYQSHAARGWYYNADNQFLETFIELGAVGLAAVVICIGCLAYAAYAAWKRRAGLDIRDVAVVLVLLLISQVDLAVTDFGITMPANLLTAALIVGAALGAFLPGEPASSPVVRGMGAIILGLLMLSLPATGLAEVAVAARQSAFLDSIPTYDKFIEPPDAQILAAQIAEGESLLPARPDNAALHLKLAELRIWLFRVEALRELQVLNPDQPQARLWELTSPVGFFRQSLKIEETGGQSALQSLRESPQTVKNLVPAWSHLRQAQATSRYQPQTHFLLGCLCPVMGASEESSMTYFKHEMALSPFDSARLLAIGFVCNVIDEPETTFTLWKRALTLDPEASRHVLRLGLQEFEPTVLLSEAIPDSIPVLLEFAEQTDDIAARKQALTRLRSLLPPRDKTTADESWVHGRAHRLEQNWTAAIEDWQRATEINPYLNKYRLDLADALEHEGRYDEALKQVEECIRYSQQDASLGVRKARLLQLQKDDAVRRAREGRNPAGELAPVEQPNPAPPDSLNTDEHAERI